jgi:hypothetical protein
MSNEDGKVKAEMMSEPPDPAVAKVLDRHRKAKARILPTPMTTQEYADLARQVAQDEIGAVATNLAAQVQQGVQQMMVPLGQRFSELYQKVNEIDVHIHALVDILVEKDICTRDEFKANVKRVTEEAIARHEARKQQADEAQSSAQ